MHNVTSTFDTSCTLQNWTTTQQVSLHTRVALGSELHERKQVVVINLRLQYLISRFGTAHETHQLDLMYFSARRDHPCRLCFVEMKGFLIQIRKRCFCTDALIWKL